MSRAACKEEICSNVIRAHLDAFDAIIDRGDMEVNDIWRLILILDQAADALAEFSERWLSEG